MLVSSLNRGRHRVNMNIARTTTAIEAPTVTNDIAEPIGGLKMPPNWAEIWTPIMLTLPPTSCGVR